MFFSLLFFWLPGFSQNIQLHYDFRHTLHPRLNSTDFPTFSFEYFKNIDTLGTGSFLMKVQVDLNGKNHNVSQVFTQLSQSLRFWKPGIYLAINYSGGLGVTRDAFGFYLANSFAAGVSYPFQWKGAWLATNLLLRLNVFEKISYDPQFTFYFGKGLHKYKFFIASSFVFWTQNKNEGNDHTKNRQGKKFAFFGDPQIWIRIKNGLSAGSRINVLYHLVSEDDQVQFYPTAGLKYQF